MPNTLTRPFVVAAACLAAGPALAQDAMDAAEAPAAEAMTDWSPDWSSDAIEDLATDLIGSWRTTDPIASSGGSAADETHVMMLIHPVPIEGMSDTVYIEGFRTDDLANPFRQAIGQFYTRRGDVRLRTFEIKLDETQMGVMGALGAVPEVFPEIAADHLIATLDVNLYPTSTGFTGRTPYPYPTANGGAVEMTSSIEVRGDTLITVERGYDADGDIVWGADEDGRYEFTRIDHPFEVEKRDNGLVIIDIEVPEGREVEAGDQLHVHYAGWLANGFRFDTSRQEGRDVFRFPYPPRLIEGWNQGLDDVTTGTVRKLVIPGDLGYGPRGQPRASIPPDARLYFTMEILLVQEPQAAPQSDANGDDQAEPQED